MLQTWGIQGKPQKGLVNIPSYRPRRFKHLLGYVKSKESKINMNKLRLYTLIAASSISMLAACSSMPTGEDLSGFSEKLKNILPSTGAQNAGTQSKVAQSKGKLASSDPRDAPFIEGSLQEMCDAVAANPVTGVEKYVDKRLTVRGTLNDMRQNYINDYDVFMRSIEGVPVAMKVNDRNIIRALEVDMKIEVTGSVYAVGDKSTISGYKNCRVSLDHVDITPLQ